MADIYNTTLLPHEIMNGVHPMSNNAFLTKGIESMEFIKNGNVRAGITKDGQVHTMTRHYKVGGASVSDRDLDLNGGGAAVYLYMHVFDFGFAKLVSIEPPSATSTTTTLSIEGFLDVNNQELKPRADQIFPCNVTSNGSAAAGSVKISKADGLIEFFTGLAGTGAFTTNATLPGNVTFWYLGNF
jgi:hypothetical protein